jgi:AcrR family transcriptional regulator
MPQLLDGRSRAEAVARAANRVILEGGVTALSLRTIGRASGVSPASLTHHFGGRERLLKICASLTARHLRDDLISRSHAEGIAAFLPGDHPESLHDARVWLAWCELGRSSAAVEPAVTEHRDEERHLLAACLNHGLERGPERGLDHGLERDGLDAMVAVVQGLRVAVCAPFEPLDLPRARTVLARSAERWIDQDGPAAASPRPRSLRTIASGSSAE